MTAALNDLAESKGCVAADGAMGTQLFAAAQRATRWAVTGPGYRTGCACEGRSSGW